MDRKKIAGYFKLAGFALVACSILASFASGIFGFSEAWFIEVLLPLLGIGLLAGVVLTVVGYLL